MRLPRLAGVILAAAAAATVPAWGQVENGQSKKAATKSGGGGGGKLSDEAEAAVLKKKFLYCKKTGDCKPYLLEKEKYKKDKPNKLEPADLAPEKPPPPPAGAGRSRGDGPAPARMPAAPPEAQGSLSGQAAGEEPWAPPPTVEEAEVAREEAAQRRERTLSRAAGAADTMRRGFLPADEIAGPGSGGPERRSASAPEQARTLPVAGEPRTVPEMALAARKGYAATFLDQGLKVGAGPRGEPAILRADGAAASPADLARLRTALSADPAALRRRPDFFEVLPREKFADLKRDFTARPELRSAAFKDIGMTARERDFQWSSSCSALSGDCNPHAAQGSYLKGQDVAPEDLDSVWSAAQEEIFGEDAEEDDGWGEYTEEERRLAAAADLAEEMLGAGRAKGPALGSLLARMGNLARDVGSAAGWAAAAPGAAENSRGATSAAAGAPASYASGPASAAPGSPSGAVPGPPPSPEGRPAANRGWLYLLAAAAAAGLLLGGLRLKNRP